MRRRDASRALTFAVTGALLGTAGAGCHHRHRGPYVNPGPALQPPGDPDGSQPEPDQPPTDEVTPTNPGPQPEPTPEPPELEPGTNNVRKVEDEPPARPEKSVKYVNTVKVPDTKPEP